MPAVTFDRWGNTTQYRGEGLKIPNHLCGLYDGPGAILVVTGAAWSAGTEGSVASRPRASCPLNVLPATTFNTHLQIPLLCRRLLSIRGVNDVLPSKGFLKSSLSSTHTRCTQRQGDGGRTGCGSSAIFRYRNMP